MKKQYRILSLILSVILLATLVSAAAPAIAATKYTYAISFK